MSHRLTKKEIDEQFELFLKESVSDDSVDWGRSEKQPHTKGNQKSTQKAKVSWWQDDEHSGGGSERETPKRRFIKAKKSQPENEVASVEPFYKPVPKPRCKAPDKPIQSDKTHKDTVLESSQTVKKARTPSEDSSSDALSKSSHENIQCASEESVPDETYSNGTDSHSKGDSEDGLLGSEKSFGTSLRKSQSVQDEQDYPEDTGLKKEGLSAVALSRDDTETEDSVMVPAVNMTSMGLDTLEEEEEKAKFFAQLEAGASSTVDYSKLNRELDSTSSTTGTNLRKTEEAAKQSDEDRRKTRDAEAIRTSTSSPHYSEDFEDEDNGKKPLDEKSQMPPILAKVSLYDSLDGTGGADRGKDTGGSLDRGLSNMQSGGSEMEALHEAYRQIHVVEDVDDHYPHNRPASPFSPPHHTRQSLQPASTNESELPTAEELMKLIRPEEDHIRGFTLQPVSHVDLKQTFQDVSHTESQLKRPGEAVAEIKEFKGLCSQPSSDTEPLKHDLTWSIREEVEKLMQDHQNSSSPHTSSDAGKAKKQPATHNSTLSHPPTSSVRKPTVAPNRSRKVQGKAAVTSGSTGLSRAAAPAKSQSSVSRGSRHPLPASITKRQKKDDDTAEEGLKASSELVASVQSLVAVLQQQIHTNSHQDPAETHEDEGAQHIRPTRHLLKSNGDEECFVVEELRVQLAQKERELQAMKEAAEELQSVRQQNYLLQSKLRSAEEENQKNRWAKATDPATEERFHQIDKEMKEQETLIKGYQQENEKLYLQMKAQQAKSKANEEAMFKENQRLLNELAFTREQLNKTSKPVGNVCLMDHTRRITDLLAQINTFQRNEAKLSEDIHTLKQEKQALEVDLQLMKKERDLAKAQVISTSGDKTFEIRVLEDKHREEVKAMRKKLQWFAENQELLDRDAARLKAATAEIHGLKEQVEQLKMEVGKRSTEQQRKAKDKSVDTKRMRDLERQVKELEQILRHRNPNSLPALIYAAASAGSQENADTPAMSPPSRITALLERRIQRLEAELESHDEEAKHSLRTMEQQFHRIKLRYEQRISELEQELQKQQVNVPSVEAEPWVSQVQSLEEELQQMKETYQEKEKGLCEQIESLQQQLKHKVQQSPGRHQRQAEAAFGVRIERLNQELAAKTRTIQELSRTVARLQKERTGGLSLSSPRPQTHSAETKQQTYGGEETFPAAQYEKTYQPTVFTGSHISEVLQENEALRQRLELLQQQSEQEREAAKAEAAQAKEELLRLEEHSAEQLSSMKTEHLRELDRLRATYALEHSSSRVAELMNQLNTHEIMVKHLQEQLTELQGAKDALEISRTREDALQKQLTRLLKELKEAKDAQSSEVKLLCSLERKLLNMELRHQHREKELQQVISDSWQTLETNQQSEVERWRRLAQEKSRELEAFRLELDSILDILRHLQRQGVIFPSPNHQQLTTEANTLIGVSERC